MPSIAGEAAVRIVPTLKGFHADVKRKIEAKKLDYDINIGADMGRIETQLQAFRRMQESNAITIPIRTDYAGFRRDLSQVEHIFERNNLVKGIRVQVKILGLDALPALAYAAGSAASGLDALAKSAFLLPGAFSAAGASLGAFAIGISGVGDAFKAHSKDANDAAKSLKDVQSAQRDLQRAQRDVTGAIRDQRRELEDLNAELRRSSLDEADALLNLQESADRLKQGGFKSITEYQRAQVRYLRDIEGLKDVRKNNLRLLEDTNAANEKGIAQGDKVVSAIDKVVDAVDRLNQAQAKTGNDFEAAMGKLSPNAQSFVTSVQGMKGAWDDLRSSVQDNLFAGLDKSVAEIGSKVLPGLKIGLSQVASGLNANIQAAVDSVGTQKNAGLWERIFGNTQGGLENLKRGLDPLITSFSRIAEVGSTFLPRLGQAFANVFTKFDQWTAKIAADGTLAAWIDQGLNSLTYLGNAAKNIGSIISSVASAFNTASGTEGGFIGSLARGTGRLAEYLRGEGRAALVDYFVRARELIRTVSDAFGDMKPLIKDIVDAARNFSMVLLPIVGGFAKLAKVIDENTGLVRAAFLSYLTWRTVAPIIDLVTNSWKNYQKVIGAAAAFGPTADHFQTVNNGLTRTKSNLSAMIGVTTGAKSALQPFNGQLSAAAKNVQNLFTPTNNLSNSLNLLGNKAQYAGQKVGTAGVRASLMGALSGLATFIGPAIGAGVLGVALSAAVLGLSKLGDAHDQAKNAADRQKESLDQLKGSLDSITGAATAASLKTAADVAQRFPMGPVAGGDRNVLNDVTKANIASPEQLIAATLPRNQTLANDINKKAIDQAADKIAQSDSYKNFKDKWESGGITPEILAKAQMGDPEALDKVSALEAEVFGKARRDWNSLDNSKNRFAGNALPSVSDTIASAGTFEQAAVGSFLRTTRDRNVQGGDAIKQATQAAGGRATLKPGSPAQWAGAEVYAGADGLGYLVLTSDPGKIDPEVGMVEQLPSGQWQVNLTQDATKKYLDIQRFAAGGLIGGKGTGTSDSNLMLASRGEFVTRKAAVDHYGAGFFERLNSMQLPKFAPGGEIPPPVIPWQDQAATALTQAGFNPAPAQLPAIPAPTTMGPVGLGDPFAATMKPIGGVTAFGGAPGTPPAPDFTTNSGDLVAGAVNSAAMDNFAPPSAPPPPPPPAPKPATPSAVPNPATPHAGTGAPPGLPQHSGSGALPGPVQPAQQSMLGRVMALSQQTGIPPQIIARFMPGGGLGGGVRVPYAGVPVGTNIPYGAGGFPDWVYQLGASFGLQASTYPGHQEAGGTNKGIDFSGPPEKMRALAEYLKNVPGVEQVIFMDPRDGTKIGVDPGDRGPNQTIDNYYRDDWATHTHHVHVRTSSSIPLPGDDGGLLGLLAASGIPGMTLPGSLDPMALAQNGTLSAGGGSSGGGTKKSGLENLVDYWTNTRWLEPENVDQFLGGTARNVGSSLLNIGTSFLQGITGLDFSSVIGSGQDIGNFILGTAGDSGGGADELNTDVTGLNTTANDALSAFLNGDPSLSASGGLDSLLGPSLDGIAGLDMAGLLSGSPTGEAGFDPKGGAEQWRPIVRRVLETYGPQYGLKNLKAWEDAIVTQIDTESKGDPGALNPNDSNGQGGTQSVAGLLQFLPETFASNNITGGDYMDPVAQIAAVIPYVVGKYGMNPDGSPRQIGKGVGYARGGKIRGKGGPRSDSNLVRVSRGEFLHNAKAVNYYGSGFLSRLNAMQIPKENLPGFADGMWWNPFDQNPAPPPGPAPLPAPQAPAPAAPAPAPQTGQSAGPLPLAAPAMAAPSTGGAPGPGATAPAPDPGALPQVSDAMAGIGQSIGSMGGALGDPNLAQPGAEAPNQADPRAFLGAAPVSQDHTLPAVSSTIRAGFDIVGGLAAQAAQAAAMGATMGVSGGVPVPGASEAGQIGGQLAQAGAKIAGEIAVGGINILSSLLVGTATNGSTASASGVPLLPQRAPMQSGVPQIGQQPYQDNRTYNLTDLGEYRRLQEREAAQNTMPFIGKF